MRVPKCSLLLPILLVSVRIGCAAPIALVASASGQFGTLDLKTGAFLLIGDTLTLSGLGGANGVIYGLDGANNLVAINPSNASVNTIGNTGLPIPAGGNPIFGSSGNKLFAMDAMNALYSLNSMTGVATLVGPSGVPVPDFSTCNCISADGIAGNGANLYFVYQLFSLADSSAITPSTLYRIDQTTGAATPIGNTASALGIVGLGAIDGALYGFAADLAGVKHSEILSLNTSTGTASFVANPDSKLDPVFGAIPAVPEPGSWILIGSGLGVLGFGGCLRDLLQIAKARQTTVEFWHRSTRRYRQALMNLACPTASPLQSCVEQPFFRVLKSFVSACPRRASACRGRNPPPHEAPAVSAFSSHIRQNLGGPDDSGSPIVFAGPATSTAIAAGIVFGHLGRCDFETANVRLRR